MCKHEGMEEQGDPFAPAGVDWRSVKPELARGRRLAAAPPFVVLAGATAAVAVITDTPVVWGGLPLALAGYAMVWRLIGRQVRSLGYAERADDLLIRSGVLLRKIVVVPYGRMQFVDVEVGPLARRLGYSKVELHTASMATSAAIPGLDPAEAARLRDQLSQRGEARLAGL